MAARVSLRFVYSYFIKLGFLDGAAGFQVATIGAVGSYLKEAKLWELQHALSPETLDAEWQFTADASPAPAVYRDAA